MKQPPHFYSAFILKIYLLLPAGGVLGFYLGMLHPFYFHTL